MAQVSRSSESKIYAIQKWLGLNESPDGDTGLRMGEAAVMRDNRNTREHHHKNRPG